MLYNGLAQLEPNIDVFENYAGKVTIWANVLSNTGNYDVLVNSYVDTTRVVDDSSNASDNVPPGGKISDIT